MAGPTFRELHAAARAHQNRQPAPAIGDVDPGALAVRGAPRSRRPQTTAPAIQDVEPDAAVVRKPPAPPYSRSRQGLRDLIASNEESIRGYDSYFGDYRPNHPARPDKPLSQMTLNEVYAYQDRLHRATKEKNGQGSTPVGRYQFTKQTLQEAQRRLGVSSDHVFDQVLQDALADDLLNHRGFNEYAQGKITASQFHGNLANEWASIERGDPGSDKYRPGKTKQADVLRAISEIDRDRDQLKDRYRDEYWEEE
jgi:hypothetical protein